MTLHHIDMFAGIGGFTLGLQRVGLSEPAAFYEIDDYARQVLERHWPDVPNFGDVIRAEFPLVDIICAGFPCQDISKLGDRAGLAGTNSGLWREVVRAVRLVRPRYVILENVADLLVREVGRVAGDLAALGYDTEWDCIPARAVCSPQRRDRWFGVAYPARLGNRLSQSSLPTRWDEPQHRAWWSSEPRVGRVADGLPDQAHRLAALGNAIVPQIAETIAAHIRKEAA